MTTHIPLLNTIRPGFAWLLAVGSTVLPPGPVSRAEAAESTFSKSVEELAETARPSVVVVNYFGRNGREEGVGAGFVVSTNGLIATCLHVIGEARPIEVRLHDGRKFQVTEIMAWDRPSDLAVVRIEADDLVPLPLGDSSKLNQGSDVVAMGNPLGLEHSIVQGVISARRDFDGQEMLQLAIPIEPGNSGGPLLDMQGRVHGLLNMKSALTRNLGFAIPINSLKTMLDKPNPVPMSRWLTIGALNPQEWELLWGARWSRKGGRIHVEEPGAGFGGRSLCLNRKTTPTRPFELAVTVRLEDESGAAGLVFGSDGADRHYGFYPSAGNLRLTRFEGPNVFTWTVLEQIPAPDHYQPGDWNRIKVRWETNKILCYLNDELVIESTDRLLPPGRVGLAKFRDTVADFKQFQIGRTLSNPEPSLSPETMKRLTRMIRNATETNRTALFEDLKTTPKTSRRLLQDRARELENQARELRQLGQEILLDSVRQQLLEVMDHPEPEINLFHAGLLIALLDNPDLDIQSYRDQIEDMAREITDQLKEEATAEERLSALNNYLFKDNGFHGSRTDYYNQANSYINAVLDDREGIPITLSIVFIELAERIGLLHVVGVSFPGHFLVKHAPAEGQEQLIDVFDNGRFINREDAERMALDHAGVLMREEHLEAAPKRAIIARMLANLLAIAESNEEYENALRYAELSLALYPEEPDHYLRRAMLRLQTRDRAGAKEDFKWLLDNEPPGINLQRIAEAYQAL